MTAPDPERLGTFATVTSPNGDYSFDLDHVRLGRHDLVEIVRRAPNGRVFTMRLPSWAIGPVRDALTLFLNNEE